tara:strand:+ start:291 stop:593 length:303 start_codon:yes stop_codon:yes gene_type:complete
MKINTTTVVYDLILTSCEAGVSASNTAKLVKYTTDHSEYFTAGKTRYETWEPSEVLECVSSLSIEARDWLSIGLATQGKKETYKFVKRVLKSLEDLYQNQ